MSCRIRALEHRKCATALAGTHPGFQGREQDEVDCTVNETLAVFVLSVFTFCFIHQLSF